MNTNRLAIVPLATLATPVALVLAFASANVASPQSSVDAPPQSPGKPFFGTSVVALGESAVLDLNVSLLPNVALADGAVVRPMSMRAIFEIEGGHYLGESRIHRLCPTGSADPIDLSSAQELDLHHFSEGSEPLLRTYDVRVSPAPGKTWGQVLSMKDDVRVVAQRR